MWILLAIIAFLAALITTILLLPIKVIIKNDEHNELILRYKYCFWTFGENPNPNDPIIKTIKTAVGMDRLEKSKVREDISTKGFQTTLKETFSILVDLLKEILQLLKRCTVSCFQVTIRCGGEDADQVAIQYGKCCAATYSLFNIVRSFLKVRKRGCRVDVGCDFAAEKSTFRYHLVLKVRAARVLAALWRVALAEARRQRDQQK